MNNPYQNIKQEEGNTFSYNEFCVLLNEPIESGKKKISQFKNWSNYMDITKGYNKITLNKIYNINEMLLISHNTKFTEYISDLIVMYLANSDKKIETLTYKEFAEYFYMVNKDYYKAKYQKNKYIDNFKLHIDLIYFTNDDSKMQVYKDMGVFFNITDKIIKEIIKNALKSLKNKGLIIYSTNFKIYKDVIISSEDSDENKFITKTYICNEEQRKEFLDIRKRIMTLHNIEKIQDIIYLDKDSRELYFDDLKQEMAKSEILYHCTKYANAFNIEYGDKAIRYEYKRILSDNRKTLNNNLQYKLLTTKELECINNVLKTQFIDSFINNDKQP